MEVGKLSNHLKLCVLYSVLFYHSTVSSGLRFIVLRFDAVPLLSQKIPFTIGAVYGNCTPSFGVVMSQFIREFKNEWSLLQRFNQVQQTIFLFITTGSTVEKRKGNILVHMLSDQSLVRLGLFLLQASIRSLIKLVALLRIYLVSL